MYTISTISIFFLNFISVPDAFEAQDVVLKGPQLYGEILILWILKNVDKQKKFFF